MMEVFWRRFICTCQSMGTGMMMAKRRSVIMLQAMLVYPNAWIVDGVQQVPFTEGSHWTARLVHWNIMVWFGGQYHVLVDSVLCRSIVLTKKQPSV